MKAAIEDKGSKMDYTYKFKANDKVKITPEAYATEICLSVKKGEELHVTMQSSWLGKPAYILQDTKGACKGLFTESEIEPFESLKIEVKKFKTPQNQVHTKTMWALVSKAAPNVIDADELFTTRSRARRCKFANDLDHLKVAKVTLTWEE